VVADIFLGKYIYTHIKMGDEISDTNVSGIVASTESVARVAVKAPPFYRKAPETWFRRLEAQFALAGITQQETMCNHVLAVLPEDIACDIEADVITYDDIKSKLVNNMKANKHKLIEEALEKMDLGEKRPSQLVSEIKRKFADIGIKAEDEIVKSRLLTALPHHLRSALVGHDSCSLEQYAKVADSIMAVADTSTPFANVSAVQRHPAPLGAPGGVGTSSRFQQPQRRDQHRPMEGFSGQRNYRTRRPRICNGHIFYAERARTCRPWCKWPGARGRILERSQKTPAQSRDSSPGNG